MGEAGIRRAELADLHFQVGDFAEERADILLAAKRAVRTPPQTNAAMVGSELTKVSTMHENCRSASRKVTRREETHLLFFPWAVSSSLPTKEMIDDASGLVDAAWYWLFWSRFRLASKVLRATVREDVGSTVLSFETFGTTNAMTVTVVSYRSDNGLGTADGLSTRSFPELSVAS